MMHDPKTVEALCRQNFFLFVQALFPVLHAGATLSRAPYLETMCWHFQEVAEGREARLLVTIPPRHLKSICGSVALPAWMLGHNPALKIMVASYGEDLARKHAADFRTLVTSPLYRRLFAHVRIDPKANRADEIRTTAGGSRKAVSLGGTVTGHGADLIIVDDLMKAQDARSERKREEVREFHEQTLVSRLDDKRTGRIIAIQQRLHEDDFAGYLIGNRGYRHLNLPAIADRKKELPLYLGRKWTWRTGQLLNPEREPQEVLDQIRREIGSYAFSAQYLQNPVPGESEFVRLDRLTLIDRPPERRDMLWVVQSWDTAIKDGPTCDFSVCTTWGWDGVRWILLEVHRERHDFPALKAAALRLSRTWRADQVLVEDSSNGTALVQQMRHDGRLEFILLAVKGDKLERLVAQTDMLQSDRVALPTETPWFAELKRELLVFPNGRHDDQVDSVSQFLHWAQRLGEEFVDRDPTTGRPLGNARCRRRDAAMAARRRRSC